jgi:hypothetical protein
LNVSNNKLDHGARSHTLKADAAPWFLLTLVSFFVTHIQRSWVSIGANGVRDKPNARDHRPVLVQPHWRASGTGSQSRWRERKSPVGPPQSGTRAKPQHVALS